MLLPLFIFLSLNCQKDIPINFDGENCIDGMPAFNPTPIPNSNEYNLVFFQNSRLEITESDRINSVEIKPGDNLVFQYEYVKNDNPNIADDEYTERIIFEIPANIDSFVISGEDLKKSNAVFGVFCFCLDHGYFWIDDGCIKGEKVDDKHWNIAINISAQASQTAFTMMLSETFKKD